jgi:beta-glucanase (GH16 family)
MLGGAIILVALAVAAVGAPVVRPPHPAATGPRHESLNWPTTTTTTSGPAASTPGCNASGQLLGTCVAPATTTPTTPMSTTSTSAPTTTSTTTTTTTTTTGPSGSGSGACAGTSPPVPAPSGAWTCTLDDEFNGTSLDTSKWQPVLTSTSGYETGPLLSSVCYVDTPDTISESGGYLNLSVIQVSPPATCDRLGGWSSTTAYEGGMIESYKLFSQQYGYFQVRAEMPPTSVPGLQETLWLYPENQSLYGPWPNSGEIDYGEFYSNYPADDVPAVHYPGSSNDPDATATNGCSLAGTTTAGQFNTYALSWTPTTITAYYNGVPCLTDVYGSHVTSPDTAPEPFNQPFFLAFTSAFGMDNSDAFQPGTTPLPATMKIDWVRVWQY